MYACVCVCLLEGVGDSKCSNFFDLMAFLFCIGSGAKLKFAYVELFHL